MNVLFFFLFSCGWSNMRQIKKARADFKYAVSCYDVLGKKTIEAGCTSFLYDRYEYEVILRCYKDTPRGKFWDNWVFRLSPAELEVAPSAYTKVSKHTICLDKEVRIEAYPSEEYEFGKVSK